ncbi:50S ribosomal protein L25/general stress protein Ctc [Candidatus Pelagibacter sp.]|nr:50S ribosomal protein L25/general stress protein Ctc [Candidatus Pelagibacter sp.]
MSLLAATIRETKTKGEVKSLRIKGMVPGIIYGGEEPNQKISVSVKEVKNLLNKENILSNIISINIDGKEQKVLPRVIDFDTVTDEPIHLDFLRIVKGAKVILEIPVKFINHELSPGLKRGGVLNIVRRKVELRCPTENIPTELVVDLNNLDIGASIKISFINLPENVTPTIQGRDFVIATVAAPTVVKEPEKPAEAEGEGGEGAEAAADGDAKPEEGAEKAADGDKGKEEGKAPAEKK